jgi:drug/metabolite transporter (DMT)-like permease
VPTIGQTHRVIAILGGLGAAAAWAVSTLCSSRSSRLIGPSSVVAWMMLVGLVITVPLAAAAGVPSRLGPASGAWLAVSGVGNVGGLVLTYRALRIGQVALVAPLVSTEGAIAALIAVLAGERLAPGVAVTLTAVVAGVWLAAAQDRPPPPGRPRAPDQPHLPDQPHAPHQPHPPDQPHPPTQPHPPDRLHGPDRPPGAPAAPHPTIATLLAMAAALAFGASLYATARAGAALPVSWVVLSARAIGAAALALPLALARRLEITRRAVPLVIASGTCEVLGFYSYTTGSRHGIAVAAILASQVGGLAALGAYFLFGERLSRKRTLGVCTMLAGVAVLSALRA